MAMNVGSPGGSNADPDVMVDINTTPLIDVMLVLLIMLIITIPIQTHAVKLNLPNTNSAPPPRPPPVVNIDIDFDGTILWDGDVIPDRAALEDRLRGIAAQADQPEVHLRPNKLVTYKYVAMVMASAQRLGVTKIGLVGNEQFVQ
jgi:biopolymer transport protein ExbD